MLRLTTPLSRLPSFGRPIHYYFNSRAAHQTCAGRVLEPPRPMQSLISQHTLKDRERSPAADEHVSKKPRVASPEASEPLDRPAPADLVLDAPVQALAAGNSLSAQGKKQGGKKSKKKQKHKLPQPYSSDDVVHRDVIALLGQDAVDKVIEAGKDWDSPFKTGQEVELTVSTMSSNGECVARHLASFFSS